MGLTITGIVVGFVILITLFTVFVIHNLNKKGITSINLPFISGPTPERHTRLEEPYTANTNSAANPTFDL